MTSHFDTIGSVIAYTRAIMEKKQGLFTRELSEEVMDILKRYKKDIHSVFGIVIFAKVKDEHNLKDWADFFSFVHSQIDHKEKWHLKLIKTETFLCAEKLRKKLERILEEE